MIKPQSFPSKFSFEEPITSMDFAAQIAAQSPGATIASFEVDSDFFAGDASSPSDIRMGGASLSGTRVIQQITGGLPGNTYLLTYRVTLSTGEIFGEQRLLPVVFYI
jgi:hypothetical protein